MRNGITKTIELIAGFLNEDEDVRSLYALSAAELNHFKKEDFPIANIQFVTSDFQNSQATFEITYLNLREETKEAPTNMLEWNDNRMENMNLAHSVLSSLKMKLQNSREHDILLESFSDPVIFYTEFQDKLDGMSVNITFNIPNRINICE